MGVRLGAALLAIAAFSAAPARAEESLACEREMTRAAALSGVPLNVLYSVGLTETGRRGELSPYDMNIDGKDVHSATLAEAMASFARAKARGARLIDIGCMQINQHWHGADFASLERDVRSRTQCRICREVPEDAARRGGQLDAGGRALQRRARTIRRRSEPMSAPSFAT